MDEELEDKRQTDGATENAAARTATDTAAGSSYEEDYTAAYGAPSPQPSPELDGDMAESTPQERRRLKRDKILGAVGDGLAAAANLYFTTRGAHDGHAAWQRGATAPQQAQARFDALMSDRARRRAAYFAGLEQARQKDAKEAAADRSQQYRDALLGLRQKQADATAAQRALDNEHRTRVQAERERHNAAAEQQSAKRQEETRRHNLAGEQQRRNDAAARLKGKTGSVEHRAMDRDGNIHTFSSEAAADNFAKQEGTYVQDRYNGVTKRTDDYGGTSTTMSSRTGAKGYRNLDPSTLKKDN